MDSLLSLRARRPCSLGRTLLCGWVGCWRRRWSLERRGRADLGLESAWPAALVVVDEERPPVT